MSSVTGSLLSEQPHYLLKLFVTTYATSSHRAIRNLTNILESQLKGDYELQVIDVREQPLMVIKENITALPLLIKVLPLPCKRMIGDMSDRVKVLAGLNLKAR
jgi:circadian clock protein KaiB